MVTYLYWAAIVVVVLIVGLAITFKAEKPILGISLGALIFFCGWVVYYYHLQQIFVKHWGGVMSITVPEGHYHMGATWKDEHLWIENFDPETNTCHFTEYSKGNVLQGRVTVKNCNPLLPKQILTPPQ